MKGIRCRWCNKDVRVNSDGTMRKHRIPGATTWSRGRQQNCPGSGVSWHIHSGTTTRGAPDEDRHGK